MEQDKEGAVRVDAFRDVGLATQLVGGLVAFVIAYEFQDFTQHCGVHAPKTNDSKSPKSAKSMNRNANGKSKESEKTKSDGKDSQQPKSKLSGVFGGLKWKK